MPNVKNLNPKLFLITLLISLTFTNCKNEEHAREMHESIASYVYAYTSGIISKADEIRVRFTSAVIDTESIGMAADGILSFSPSIDGTASWEDDHTLLFQPEGYLTSGKSYVGTVALRKLFDNLPKEAGSFEFDFRTKDQGFSVGIDGLRAEDGKDLTKQRLEGKVITYDVADGASVEKTMQIAQKNDDFEIDWEHSSDGFTHQFVVKGIQRGAKPSAINLKWNGAALSVQEEMERKIEVPSLDDFKVTDARVEQSDGQSIILTFSDPILKSQELAGLIRLRNYNGNLDFTIDGNQVRIYPKGRLTGEQTLDVEPGIKNINKAKMKKAAVWTLAFEALKPQVRLVGRGVIMPNSEGLIFPFEAVSLTAVEVEVLKIYNNNILQFLQTNELSGSNQLERVGRLILQEKVSLSNLNPQSRTSSRTRYALDLSQLMETDPNAIYQVRIGFRPEYSTYFCGEEEEEATALTVASNPQKTRDGEIESFWGDWYGIDGYYEDFEWEHKENPCFPAYFNYENFVRSNVIASDLGITAKGGKDGTYFVAVADLKTTNSVSNASLEFYDFQQQLIETTTTDGDGIAKIELKRKPFVVIAKEGAQIGYLKMQDGNALSLSRYDVSGAVPQKGLKGFIYGERGVWRPGDSLYLNFILEDKTGKLPANHPISFELRDPRGQTQVKRTVMENVDGVYPIFASTNQEAPTGNWRATVKAGGATFTKILKIETVKPNRLKINLDFGKESLSARDEPMQAKLQVNWLHGAPAKNLDAKIEMEVQQTNTTFNNFGHFEFDDPARKIHSEPITIFEGKVDETGLAHFETNIYNNNKNAPGKLKASFRTRAFEKGGDFSSDNQTFAYSPYPAYVGLDIPENKYGSKRMDINKDGTIHFVALNEDGSPMANRKINIGLYRVEWRWWWDRGWDNVSRYNTSNHNRAQETVQLTTNSKGEISWTTKVATWGRYLVRVCDIEGDHCSGDFFYAGYPWYGDDSQGNRKEAAMMAFNTDKKKYEVGETIELTVPAGEAGRVLITLENGTQVIDSRWDEATKGDNVFKFEAVPEMSPTIYAHVSLIQPHAQASNDLPIRMYGVIPIDVEDPKTILKPTLKMPKELKPETKFTVEVGEENGEEMAYTIAVVDDGLLDLTRFKTPDPHAALYAREALGVQTWDVYDHVLGAYGGELERILSIGGDGEIDRSGGKKKANRFKAVVMHLGPFHLPKGKKVKHILTMPNYVGSVRTMVVAANKNAAYGNTEKTTPVRKPLMLLATLPRVLGPEETLKMPVSIFAMDKKVKNVTVSIQESTGMVDLVGSTSQKLNFANPDEKMLYFDIKVKPKVGMAKFKITAKGGGEVATQDIEIDIRNPNPYVTSVFAGVVNAGETWTKDFEPIGMYGTNQGVLEVSNIPPINLGERLQYLIRYPHGCIEQTTSSGFPQLFVNQLIELTESQKKEIPRNIQGTVERLKMFQMADGGFTYWPGNGYSEWGTNYAGHFLLEAKALGYNVSQNTIDRWVKFQKKKARQWDPNSTNRTRYSYSRNKQLMQAYRLYDLALSGNPEMGAMNRLRETKNLENGAKWRLAAAYALSGKKDIAKKIIENVPTKVEEYIELSYSYGSDLRDMAMILETFIIIGDNTKAAEMTREISERLSSQNWYNTHALAYSLMAVGKYVGGTNFDDKLQFVVQFGNGKKSDAGTELPMMHLDVPMEDASKRKVTLTNSGKGALYTRLILTGQPVIGDQEEAANNLSIEVAYRASDGTRIEPSSIEQGTDFFAEVTIYNPASKGMDYEEMALSQIFPSGWEILNTRMDNFNTTQNSSIPEYQDIRDDRVYSYFDIRKNNRQTYRVQLNAAYPGRYYLPTVSCEAMYDNTIYARVPGEWVEVVKAGEI